MSIDELPERPDPDDLPDTAEIPLPTTEGPPPGPSSGPSSGARPGVAAGPRLSLRLREPGELVAAVPHLIGFRPQDSMVLIAITAGDGGRPQLGAVVRTDLPDPADLLAVLARCARRMGRAQPEEVALVVIGGEDGAGGDGPPRPDVAEGAEQMFAAARVPVRTRLWVRRIASGQAWRCYPPCDCHGTLGELDGSAMAMASTMLGQVTYGSRAEMEASLAPEPAACGPRRRRLLDEAFDAAVLDRELGGPAAALRDLETVRAAADELAAGRALGDVELARAAVALCDPTVRDTCFGWALGRRAAAAEQLWTYLVRAVPEPEVAEPAVLLAGSVLVRGGGALVGAAIQRARRADPDHTLTGLLEELLERGVGRQELQDWMRDASREARARIPAAAAGG